MRLVTCTRSVLCTVALAGLLTAGLVVDAAPAMANGILVTSTGGQPITGPVPPPHPRHERRVRPPSPVTLKGHSVSAVINDNVAEVTVEQTFHNNSGRQLEGTYLFPLPEGASVSQWSMTMFGKMVRGEIMEAKQARRIYEDIVRNSRDPGLLEYLGRGLFRARVFPIMPHKDLTIRLTFQQVLPEDSGTLEFRYPLSTDRFNHAPVQSAVVDVKVESSIDLKAIYSPTHNVEVAKDGDRKARISYERSGRKQDKDIVLYINRSTKGVGFSLQSHRPIGKDGTFMMVLAPRTEVRAEDLVPKDVIYVVDTSSSMAGPKMEQARRALQYGVRLLRPADRFNVIGFATTLHPFQDELKGASSEMKEAAVRWIDALQPAGATNINDALIQALQQRSADENRLFMVVFLTDGKPTVVERNTDKILANVKAANSKNSRVFTFGVGYDLDVALLDKIADANRGARDYVRPDEDIEVVTGRFFKKVEQPVLSDVTIEYGAGVSEIYPRELPDLFVGSQVVVFGRYKQAGDRTIRLKGKVGAKQVTLEYQANLRQGEGAAYLPRLWAHRKIAYLLDEIRLHGTDKELVGEVVRLATKYAIVTPYTSGLVVEESELSRIRPGNRPAPRRSAGPVLDGLTLPRGAARAGKRGPRTGAPPASAPSPADRKQRLEDSDTLRKMKEDMSHDDADYGEATKAARRRVKTGGGKTFKREAAGRWIDTKWDGKTTPTQIEAFSKPYFDLIASAPKVAKYLAVSDHVLFVHAGTVYEIVTTK